MTQEPTRQTQLEAVLKTFQLPPAIAIRCWTADDLAVTQQLSEQNNWPTQHEQAELIASWYNSWPALVMTSDERVVGYVRALTDRYILLHIADLIVDPAYRKQGLGRLLLDVCHAMYPRTLMALVAEEVAVPFYVQLGFRAGDRSYAKKYTPSTSLREIGS